MSASTLSSALPLSVSNNGVHPCCTTPLVDIRSDSPVLGFDNEESLDPLNFPSPVYARCLPYATCKQEIDEMNFSSRSPKVRSSHQWNDTGCKRPSVDTSRTLSSCDSSSLLSFEVDSYAIHIRAGLDDFVDWRDVILSSPRVSPPKHTFPGLSFPFSRLFPAPPSSIPTNPKGGTSPAGSLRMLHAPTVSGPSAIPSRSCPALLDLSPLNSPPASSCPRQYRPPSRTRQRPSIRVFSQKKSPPRPDEETKRNHLTLLDRSVPDETSTSLVASQVPPSGPQSETQSVVQHKEAKRKRIASLISRLRLIPRASALSSATNNQCHATAPPSPMSATFTPTSQSPCSSFFPSTPSSPSVPDTATSLSLSIDERDDNRSKSFVSRLLGPRSPVSPSTPSCEAPASFSRPFRSFTARSTSSTALPAFEFPSPQHSSKLSRKSSLRSCKSEILGRRGTSRVYSEPSPSPKSRPSDLCPSKGTSPHDRTGTQIPRKSENTCPPLPRTTRRLPSSDARSTQRWRRDIPTQKLDNNVDRALRAPSPTQFDLEEGEALLGLILRSGQSANRRARLN